MSRNITLDVLFDGVTSLKSANTYVLDVLHRLSFDYLKISIRSSLEDLIINGVIKSPLWRPKGWGSHETTGLRETRFVFRNPNCFVMKRFSRSSRRQCGAIDKLSRSNVCVVD